MMDDFTVHCVVFFKVGPAVRGLRELIWVPLFFLSKVKLSLCLAKHHAMKTYAGVSALHGSELTASRPGRFTA